MFILGVILELLMEISLDYNKLNQLLTIIQKNIYIQCIKQAQLFLELDKDF